MSERQHAISGPHYDTCGHNPSLCLLELPHCGPCWVRGEPMPQHLRDYYSSLAIWLDRGRPGPLCIDGRKYRRWRTQGRNSPRRSRRNGQPRKPRREAATARKRD